SGTVIRSARLRIRASGCSTVRLTTATSTMIRHLAIRSSAHSAGGCNNMAVSTNALFSFAAGALLLAVGCREPEQAAVPSFVVNVASCHIDAPDTVRPGWSRMRVEEEGSPHVVVLFRMPDDVAASAISSFVAALDTSRMTPAGAIALGGPEVGQVGEIMHDLTPGEYLLACLMRGEDGHRHAMAGEVRVLHVRGERQALEPPTDAIALGMRDYI